MKADKEVRENAYVYTVFLNETENLMKIKYVC